MSYPRTVIAGLERVLQLTSPVSEYILQVVLPVVITLAALLVVLVFQPLVYLITFPLWVVGKLFGGKFNAL